MGQMKEKDKKILVGIAALLIICIFSFVLLGALTGALSILSESQAPLLKPS
jgi:hypothetical protein